MQPSSVTIASFSCKLSELTAYAQDADQVETIFELNQPFWLKGQIEFGESGAIALLALQPTLRMEFFAKAVGLPEELRLGEVMIACHPDQLRYEPVLSLPGGLAKVGGVTETVYKISALVRVGASRYPAMVTGVMEALLIQTYSQ